MVTHTRRRRRFRRAERGTTVVIVVMVATLITAIGTFAVHNIGQVDLAVGYSRQSAQTYALAELGTTAAMAQIAATGTAYSNLMSETAVPPDPANPNAPRFKCLANGRYYAKGGSSCFRIQQDRLESMTTSNGGETLLEPTVAGTESGSFGILSNTIGLVDVELTEKRPTNRDIAGSRQGSSAFDITLTTTAVVSPPPTAADPCSGIASMTVKKVMRAHVIIPPDPGT
ncbi:MAG: hypothetical protein K0R38_3114 [Polyangiaceae bacterium]|jgi:hypothetical protein|nr:hypothetical protein [Polyangiaceae bacterium]